MSGPRLLDFEPPAELVEHMVRKHQLRDAGGVVRCITCRVRVGLPPSLECAVCAERRRNGEPRR